MRRRVRALALVAILLLASSSLCLAQDDDEVEPSKPVAPAEQPGETDAPAAADKPRKPAEAPVAEKEAKTPAKGDTPGGGGGKPAGGDKKPAAAAAGAGDKKPAAGGGGDKPKPKPQQASKPPEKKGKSNIIPTAGEADLPNGVGDVLPKGPCAADAAAYCKGVSPGDGRLAACLDRKISEHRLGNLAGRGVMDACREDIASYKMARNANINRDPPLARACKDDVAQYCANATDTGDPGGEVIYCLRNVGTRLAEACKREVIRTMLEVADDYRLDPKLAAECDDAVAQHCADVEPGEGREVACLAGRTEQLAWGCLQLVLMFQKQAVSDIRLNVRLFRACLPEQQRFCADVEPGHMRVQECLEDNIDEPAFGPFCRATLDELIAARVANFTMDEAMVDACAEDLEAKCATPRDELDLDNNRKAALACLQNFRDELKSADCRDKVHRQMKRAARSADHDGGLAVACAADRKRLCPGVEPGSARVIRCLQDTRERLEPDCSAALFDHEVKMAEDIDFKYPMRRACGWEIATLCKDVPHGHARVVRCLQKQLQHEDMSSECRAEVQRDAQRAATDYRLNYRLARACKADIAALCGGVCPANASAPCGGRVLGCLAEHEANLTSTECTEEVFYYRLMGVSDFRNDVLLAEACRPDVDKYCRDVEPGEGRVHACLRHQMNFLTPACAAAEQRLAAAERTDIRLRPRLAAACAHERATFCGDVPPGRGRVIRCLLEHAAAPQFGFECQRELQARVGPAHEDAAAAGADVLAACGDAVNDKCSAALSKLRGATQALQCLVGKYDEVDEDCQAEIGRAARLALWDYSASSALTAVCDDDVAALCPKYAATRPGGVFTIGAAGRCLSKALAERRRLAPRCAALVLAAAPRDARAFLSYPEATSRLVARVADLQRAAGLEGVLVDAYRSGGGAVTVTGWAALACLASMALVAMAGAAMLARRAAGVDRPHTQYVKSGDA